MTRQRIAVLALMLALAGCGSSQPAAHGIRYTDQGCKQALATYVVPDTSKQAEAESAIAIIMHSTLGNQLDDSVIDDLLALESDYQNLPILGHGIQADVPQFRADVSQLRQYCTSRS